jgi:hypothetical protein
VALQTKARCGRDISAGDPCAHVDSPTRDEARIALASRYVRGARLSKQTPALPLGRFIYYNPAGAIFSEHA